MANLMKQKKHKKVHSHSPPDSKKKESERPTCSSRGKKLLFLRVGTGRVHGLKGFRVEQDIFVLKSELPGGYGPIGGQCKFKVAEEGKGPSAKDVMLLGAAGQQAQQMKSMTYVGSYGGKGWDKGSWGKGSGWDFWEMDGKGSFGGYDPWMGMGMVAPPWKGYGKGYGW